MTFGVDAGNGTTERMRIDSSGNVGIGTSSPGSKLDVSGKIKSTALDIGTTVGQTLDFFKIGSANYIWAADAAPILIGTNNAERMRIDSSGNVGIGTSSITNSRLQIKGANNNVGAYADGLKVTSLNESVEAQYSWWGINANSSLQFATGGSERARIDASGNLLVGTTTVGTSSQSGVTIAPGSATYQAICHANGVASGNSYVTFSYNGTIIGSIAQSGTTAVLYNVTSDARLKENVANADDAASLIDALQVRKFDWKADDSHQRYGFVAQELLEVAPEAVHQPADPDEMMAVDYSKLVPMLVKEIQSMRARLAELEGK